MKSTTKINNILRDKIFLALLKEAKLPEPTREFIFFPGRKWRFDFAFVADKIAIEIEGGAFGRVVECNHCHNKVFRFIKDKNDMNRKVFVTEGMGHNTGKGMEQDMEKYNHAALLGWKVFRFHSSEINKRETIDFIKNIFVTKEKNYCIEEKLF